MPKLVEFQQTFHDCLLQRDMASLEDYLGTCNKIPATERLSVYRANMYMSLKDVLADTFSRVCKLIGDDCFQQLAFRFVAQHPPQSGCLLDYGEDFPGFVENFPELSDYPYLADVARLDWFLNAAYYDEDSTPITPDAINKFPPEQLPKLVVKFPTATYFLQSKFPLRHIWELASDEREDTIDINAGGNQAIVIRPEMKIQLYWLEAEAYEFLNCLFKGQSLEQAFAAAIKFNPEFDLQSMLVTCLQNQYFCGMHVPK